MSWSGPDLMALLGAVIGCILIHDYVGTAGMAVFLVGYSIAAYLLWIYSPYSQEHVAFATAPKVVKDGEWGFGESENDRQ